MILTEDTARLVLLKFEKAMFAKYASPEVRGEQRIIKWSKEQDKLMEKVKIAREILQRYDGSDPFLLKPDGFLVSLNKAIELACWIIETHENLERELSIDGITAATKISDINDYKLYAREKYIELHSEKELDSLGSQKEPVAADVISPISTSSDSLTATVRKGIKFSDDETQVFEFDPREQIVKNPILTSTLQKSVGGPPSTQIPDKSTVHRERKYDVYSRRSSEPKTRLEIKQELIEEGLVVREVFADLGLEVQRDIRRITDISRIKDIKLRDVADDLFEIKINIRHAQQFLKETASHAHSTATNEEIIANTLKKEVGIISKKLLLHSAMYEGIVTTGDILDIWRTEESITGKSVNRKIKLANSLKNDLLDIKLTYTDYIEKIEKLNSYGVGGRVITPVKLEDLIPNWQDLKSKTQHQIAETSTIARLWKGLSAVGSAVAGAVNRVLPGGPKR